ncbi:MAG: hypothetical protein QM820_33395 [Minicystis sp.]
MSQLDVTSRASESASPAGSPASGVRMSGGGGRGGGAGAATTAGCAVALGASGGSATCGGRGDVEAQLEASATVQSSEETSVTSRADVMRMGPRKSGAIDLVEATAPNPG